MTYISAGKQDNSSDNCWQTGETTEADMAVFFSKWYNGLAGSVSCNISLHTVWKYMHTIYREAHHNVYWEGQIRMNQSEIPTSPSYWQYWQIRPVRLMTSCEYHDVSIVGNATVYPAICEGTHWWIPLTKGQKKAGNASLSWRHHCCKHFPYRAACSSVHR